ncbi:hypothetical protein FPV67DRAFT_1411313 [Lyophyllum atratum]|nr:hypothetical protein FPV67DRAFT_1411313 [Lyophyllum atratum]
MSSKRGRKRNDNLPPNRARDVQRAFRARRAAHLLALEQRVSELEVENAKLRKMVGWPPDDRPPLGKGPTGKDKPREIDGGSGIGSHAVDFFSSRDSESADSSSRTSSLSPSAMVETSSRAMHVIDPESWEQALTMNDHNDQTSDVGPPEPSYQLPPMAPPVSTKPIYPSGYGTVLSSSLPSSSSRSPIPSSTSTMYMTSPAGYSHSNERHLGGSYSSPSFVARGGEMRVDSPRQHYSYHQPAYQGHDPNIHPQSPPPLSTTPAHSHSHGHLQQRDITTPFAHRRSLTEQYSISHSLHLPNPAQLHPQQNTRPPDLHRMQDVNEQQQHAYRMAYAPDGGINSMP